MPAARRSARLVPATALAALLLASALPGPVGPAVPADAQPAGQVAQPLLLEYTVRADDPALLAQGKVQLTWKVSGFQGRVSAFCLQLDNHQYPVDPGTFGPLKPGGLWEDHPQDADPSAGRIDCKTGYRAVVSGLNEASASMVLDVKKPAFTACGCEFNSHLSTQWGIIKAEAFALPFGYAYFAPEPAFRGGMAFVLPPEWKVETPFRRTGDFTFELPQAGSKAPLPRGFLVLGKFTPELRDERGSIGKEFVYVRLASELRTKDSLFDYLKKATPYYQGVYGNVTGENILIVSAGPPMFTGGLGSTDSLFVHQNSSAETIAHEYAHVWQRFQTIDIPGHSSIWVNEGDADLHGALSRFVTETHAGFTLAKLNQEFKESYDKHANDPDFVQPMTVAAYGGAYEQVAYKKGLAVLVFLDQELRRLSNNSATLNDVLRELNTYYDTVIVQRTGDKRMTNQDVLDVVHRVLQRAGANVDMKAFWDRYVLGSEWPPYRELPAEVPVTYDDLQVSATEVEPNAPITVTAKATNLRERTETRTVEVFVDDARVATRSFTVGPLATVPLSFTVNISEPGNHVVRVAYLRQDVKVLTPAALVVEGAAPVTPAQAGVAFDLAVILRNTGEAPARATVQVGLGGQQKSTEVEVAGLTTARPRLSFLVAEEGSTPAEVLVTWGQGRSATGSAAITIGPRDSDDDGVPDRDDAFPDNPKLSERGVVNDLRNSTPGFEALAVVGALGVALLVLRRR